MTQSSAPAETDPTQPVPLTLPAPRSALVTGATGYVGINLVRRLVDLGWTVRTLDIRPFPTDRVAVGAFEQHTGDVRNPADVGAAVAGMDVVFHLASKITLLSEDPVAWDINVNGPATVARAALDAGVPKLVHCSSVHAFDLSAADPYLDESTARSVGPDRPLYDRSKNAGEEQVRQVIDDGLDATIVNPTGIIGPIDLGPSRINAALLTASHGRLPVALEGGFDWVDVRDVAEALISAVDRGRTGESYIAYGHFVETLRLTRMAAGLNGRLGPLFGAPMRIVRAIAPIGERIGRLVGSDAFTPAAMETLFTHDFVNTTKARDELGHHPRPVAHTVGDLVGAHSVVA